MVSKAKLRRRAKRAAVKKKYADIKAQKSNRVDTRVAQAMNLQGPEGLKVNDEEINRKFFNSLSRYKNKKLED